MPRVDWSKSIGIIWDERRRENSVVRVPSIKVPGDPPTVPSRRAVWEVSSFYPRVFGAAYLETLYGSRLTATVMKGSAPSRLLLAP